MKGVKPKQDGKDHLMHFVLLGLFPNEYYDTHQTKPVGRLGLRLQDQSLQVSLRLLCSCWPTEGFPAGKRQKLVFLSARRWTRLAKKKRQRTTQIESPEFLCIEICFNWCMAFISYCQNYFLTICHWICFATCLSAQSVSNSFDYKYTRLLLEI